MFQRTRARISKAIHESIDPSKENIKSLRADFVSRIMRLKANRSSELQEELKAEFSNVLRAWGITEEELPATIRALRLRLLICAAPLGFGAVLAIQADAVPLSSSILLSSLLLLVAAGVAGLFTTLWRLSVLESREFIPFCQWLLPFLKT